MRMFLKSVFKSCSMAVAITFFLILCQGFGSLIGTPVPPSNQRPPMLVGAHKCTWGPSYWCNNLINARGCNAVSHCIQTVWEKQNVPTDNDSVCQICKDMVTQARDQLRSNETMDELKQVFEGSCNLIPIKVIRKECSKLADDFIPELVETLSSEMNPDQVCTVAGLCNNVEIDKLLEQYYNAAFDGTLMEHDVMDSDEVLVHQLNNNDKSTIAKNTALYVNTNQKEPEQVFSCGNCFNMATLMVYKFTTTNRDSILQWSLDMCAKMSSFSDACANLVLVYFNDIYEHLRQNLGAVEICDMAGVCTEKYHSHAKNIESNTKDVITLIDNNRKDDISCEFCEQLVRHLRDVLVANTTEDEFKQVLQGFCNQTKGFRSECLGIVDQYYDLIYNSLVNELDANRACLLIGICHKSESNKDELSPSTFLPTNLPPAKIAVTIRKKLGANEPKFTAAEVQAMTLPIDKLMGAANPSLLVANGEMCTLCEYVLHFIQNTLATPNTAEEIKNAVNTVCDKLPPSLGGQCHDFIETYGDAIIALLIQGLDPRDICPKLQMCPKNVDFDRDFELIIPVVDSSQHWLEPKKADKNKNQDKPTCPLCLFAVEQAQIKIRDNKSKDNIKDVLNHLCNHLPDKLQTECTDFIKTYTSELIDLLITDFKPQEICVALKLCPTPAISNSLDSFESDLDSMDTQNQKDHDILTNSIIGSSDTYVNIDVPAEDEDTDIVLLSNREDIEPNCIICKKLVNIAEKNFKVNGTKEEIKIALEKSCDKLKSEFRSKCHMYVEKYGDKMAEMIAMELEPKIICTELGLCLFSEQEDLEIDEALKYDVIAMPNDNEMNRYALKNIEDSEEESLSLITFKALPETKVDDDPPTCILCEFILTKIEMELRNKTEQEKIKEAVEDICNKMPKTVSHSCNIFMEKYTVRIINLLSIMPPKEVCKEMELCSHNQLDFSRGITGSKQHVLRTNRNHFLPQINRDVIECGVCHGVTTALLPYFKSLHSEQSNLISKKDNTETITEMVAVGCEHLPSKYYEMCHNLLLIYGKSIMNLSLQYQVEAVKNNNLIDVSLVCSTIGKCYKDENSALAFTNI